MIKHNLPFYLYICLWMAERERVSDTISDFLLFFSNFLQTNYTRESSQKQARVALANISCCNKGCQLSAVSDVTQKIWPLLQQGKSAVSDVTQQLWLSLQQECQLSVTSVNSYGCRCNKGCQLSVTSLISCGRHCSQGWQLSVTSPNSFGCHCNKGCQLSIAPFNLFCERWWARGKFKKLRQFQSVNLLDSEGLSEICTTRIFHFEFVFTKFQVCFRKRSISNSKVK